MQMRTRTNARFTGHLSRIYRQGVYKCFAKFERGSKSSASSLLFILKRYKHPIPRDRMVDDEIVFHAYLNVHSSGSEQRRDGSTVYFLSERGPVTRDQILQSDAYLAFVKEYGRKPDRPSPEDTTGEVGLERVFRALRRGPSTDGEGNPRIKK